MADPKEVFAVYDCEDIELYRFIKPLHIQYSPVPDNWSSLGGTTESIVTPTTHIGGQDQILWYRKLYDPDTAGFLEVPPILLHDDDGITCFTCSHFESEFNNQTPIFEESSNTFVYKQQTFTKKCAVMLTPNSFNLTFRKKKGKIRNVEAKDPNLYPEYWNKKKKKSKLEVSDPFDIGIIEDMYVDQGKKVMVRVRCMYRPENIGYDWEEIVKQDINKVYWTESKVSLSAKNIEGLCHVELRSNITEKEPFLWSQKGLFKFYYEEAFNIESNQLEPLNEEAKNYAQPSDSNQDFPTLERPLNMLDVFSGCGGLSIGLEQSGVAKCRWAIEWDADAAQAFKTNHSEDCKVVVDDVNKVLREIIDQGDGDDERANSRKEKLPKKGEVDLMCGGPPCQGFSVMNTFHESDKARFKNSLIATYLSFCDYFRPSYFILENVKNFAQFNGGRILILCMRALVMMGYQCQFGVLQAGNFGVAQNRKRAILLAAAPNCPLPHFPAIMNVFEQMPLTINVDDKSFDVNSNHWRNNSAPYRNMTARDAISDLTDTNKGGQKVLCDDPVTWLQRTIRWCHKKQAYISQVSHHEEKGTSEIVMARIACIPKTLGADWRDLPNKCVDLPSGRKATKIKYPYIDIKTKKPAVCSCSTKQGQCRVMDRQDYTLIPFALVHKAKNHSQWKNCYGRVHWDTYFSTTTTNIHPEGKQGRVLHPEQDRVLSVRECARSQGFPDYAEFCGSIHDKYKQIGNAVPPPMARALGISILCAQAETESLKLLY